MTHKNIQCAYDKNNICLIYDIHTIQYAIYVIFKTYNVTIKNVTEEEEGRVWQ